MHDRGVLARVDGRVQPRAWLGLGLGLGLLRVRVGVGARARAKATARARVRVRVGLDHHRAHQHAAEHHPQPDHLIDR